jgi:hypothetical protein
MRTARHTVVPADRMSQWAQSLLTTTYVDDEVVCIRTYDHTLEVDVMVEENAPLITTYRHEYPGDSEVTVTSP